MTQESKLFNEAQRQVKAGKGPVILDLENWAEDRGYEFSFEQYADAIELAYNKQSQGGPAGLAARLP